MKTLFSILLVTLFLSACGRSPESQAGKGIDALNQGRSSKAAKLLAKAAEKSEGEVSADRWAKAGLAAARAEKRGDAEAYFLNAIAINDQHFEALYNLGDVLLQQNRMDEAVPYFTQAVNANPDRTEALEVLAGIALDNQDFERALDLLNRARAREEHARVLSAFAVAGTQRFSVGETRDLLQRAVTLDPGYAPAQLNLAALLDQNRLDPAQAVAHYEAYIRLKPEDMKIPLVRQRIQRMEDRQESGEYSQPDPVRTEVERYLAQASTVAAQGQDALALQFCLRANAAATRAQRTDLRERALRAATTLVPDSARAHFGLGQFMLAQNRKTEALVSLEKAHQLAPGWPMVLRPTVLLASELNQRAMADSLLKTTETAGAANPDLLLEVGDLYAEALNNEKESRRMYRELIENFPDYEKIADVQARLNR